MKPQQLRDQTLKFSLPSNSESTKRQHSPLADISNTHKSGVLQTTNYCQITTTSSNQNLECTDLHSSDSDFEIDSPLKTKVHTNHALALCEDNKESVGKLEPNGEENSSENKPVEWNHLDPCLQALLPSEKGLTYVITELNQLPVEEFPGAPEYYSYEATVRIDIVDKEAAQSWMQKMMQHSKCTYRHS